MKPNRVGSGIDIPNDFNVIIEIPMNTDPIKYENRKKLVQCLLIDSCQRACITLVTMTIFRTRNRMTVIRLMCW